MLILFDIPLPPEDVATAEPVLYLFVFTVIVLIIIFVGVLRYITSQFVTSIRDSTMVNSANAEKQAERDQTILEILRNIVAMLKDVNDKVDKIPESRESGGRRWREI